MPLSDLLAEFFRYHLEAEFNLLRMRKITFIILSLFSLTIHAEWSLINSSQLGNLYIDYSKTRSKAGIHRVWTLMDFAEIKIDASQSAEPFLSRIAIVEYDCLNQRSSLLSLSSYAASMASGRVVASYDNRQKDWIEIPPNTLIETVFDKVCSSK